ncbi:uncharacterized protein LOC129566756 [Sitodiplosis mosellana]|uniref:uncharacterized protein LOC129566756 n=1 Tax=Sitodiplosis mosellana TaxID=263140 RepID=UPI0024446433|nr:uncharacterized protein LOC129566756 [Sitodiplosis mosellana]
MNRGFQSKMVSSRILKNIIFYCLGVLLLISKSNTISAIDEVGGLKVNEFVVAPEIEAKLGELSKHVNVPRSWRIDLNLEFINNHKLHENITSMFEYYNKVFHVMLLMFFGISCDWKKIQTILRFPVGPVIAAFCRWIYVPLACYSLGLLLFKDKIPLRMGLFLTALKPTGAFSTAWTIILNGNIDLSVTICVVNTVLSYGMTTFWLSTLVKQISDNVDIEIITPFLSFNRTISYTIVPLAVGILLQYIFRRQYTRYSRNILMWTATTYVFSNILYTIVLDTIIFFSFPFPMFWLFLLIGFVVASSSYLLGWVLALAFKQEYEDCLAIAVESTAQTGVYSMKSLVINSFFLQNDQQVALRKEENDHIVSELIPKR